jgi:hypothetical protein
VELIHVPTEAKGDCEETNDPYVQAILTTEDSSFDIVVVDGQARNACCKAAAERLRPGGLLVLDNSDRITYEPAHQFMALKGYSRLDFSGPVPGGSSWSCTSVFFKSLDGWLTSESRPPRWKSNIRDLQSGFPFSDWNPVSGATGEGVKKLVAD